MNTDPGEEPGIVGCRRQALAADRQKRFFWLTCISELLNPVVPQMHAVVNINS